MFVIVGKNSFINVLGLFVERSLILKKTFIDKSVKVGRLTLKQVEKFSLIIIKLITYRPKITRFMVQDVVLWKDRNVFLKTASALGAFLQGGFYC